MSDYFLDESYKISNVEDGSYIKVQEIDIEALSIEVVTNDGVENQVVIINNDKELDLLIEALNRFKASHPRSKDNG